MVSRYLIVYVLSGIFSWSLQSAVLESINFFQENNLSNLELSFDELSVKASKIQLDEDKQIIVDIKDVTASDKVLRAFDTSEFSGSIVYVDAYKKPGTDSDLRLVIQLRENVRAMMNVVDKKLHLQVENHFGALTQKELDLGEGVQATGSLETVAHGLVHIPKSDSVEDILENLTLSGQKKYIGKKISFNFKNINIEDIMHMIATSSGFNIILNQAVKSLPSMSLALTNISWDQALDTILGINKLVASKNGNILMITTLDQATREKEQEIAAQRTVSIQEPLVTKIFPLSYAELGKMDGILKGYLTERGTTATDDRTNSLIVKDTVAVMEKVKKIIEVLDTQTPQILIQAKFVEVTESHSSNIGLSNGLTLGYDPISSMSGISNTGPGFSFNTTSTAVDGAFATRFDQFGRVRDLNFVLNLLESEKKSKTIASPKIITQNKKAATITQGTEIMLPSTSSTTTVSGTTGTTSYEKVNADLNLTVTPQVTNDGSILMDVNISKGVFVPGDSGPPSVNNRTITTNVLVDNGSTVVLGGVYSYDKLESHRGIPFLKDIPILGWLFRTPYNPLVTKTEMMVFLTPRIINQEEAGLVDREHEQD